MDADASAGQGGNVPGQCNVTGTVADHHTQCRIDVGVVIQPFQEKSGLGFAARAVVGLKMRANLKRVYFQ